MNARSRPIFSDKFSLVLTNIIVIVNTAVTESEPTAAADIFTVSILFFIYLSVLLIPEKSLKNEDNKSTTHVPRSNAALNLICSTCFFTCSWTDLFVLLMIVTNLYLMKGLFSVNNIQSYKAYKRYYME